MSMNYDRQTRRESWSEAKKEYVDTVLSKVRFTWDYEEIEAELDGHLLERSDYLQQERGMPAEEADTEALKRMGNPETIGLLFDKAHNPWIGRLWLVTNVIFAVVLAFYLVNMWQLHRIEAAKYPFNWVPATNEQVIEGYEAGNWNEELIFHVECDEVLNLENYQIRFTDVICASNGDYTRPYEQGDYHIYIFYERTGEGGEDAILYLTPAFFKDDQGRTLAADAPWLEDGHEDWQPDQLDGEGGVFGPTYDAHELGRFQVYGFIPGTKYIDVVYDAFGQKDSCRLDLTGAIPQMEAAGLLPADMAAEGVSS